MRVRRYLPFVLAAALLVSDGRVLLESLRSFHASDLSTDSASIWESRMRLVAEALPSDVRVVGYLERASLDSSRPRRDQAEFYLTQYGLAPVVVRAGVDHEWIIGNFGSAFSKAEVRSILDQEFTSHNTQALGFGIYLIHRLPR